MMLAMDLQEEIQRWKERRGALILAHNYQLAEVQRVADHVGDSLELARLAAAAPQEVVVLCGVSFMAETVALLCPDKVVLHPEPRAGCPLADRATPAQVAEARRRHPGAAFVCYVNSHAAVKALCDVCCTSANAVEVVDSLEAEQVVLLPDRNLARYVGSRTSKRVIPWDGWCPAHVRMCAAEVRCLRARFPQAELVVHPECEPEVVAEADAVLSTGGMLRWAARSPAEQIIVGTEVGMIWRLRQEHPHKLFLPLSEQAICPDMKLITLEKVLESLREMVWPVTVHPEVAAGARRAVERMLGR